MTTTKTAPAPLDMPADTDRLRYIEAAQLDETMREQIATAQPCDDCGDFGHDAADHDVEPSPVELELERVLAASLPRCVETRNPGVWPYVARCVLRDGHAGEHADQSQMWS